MLPEGLGDMISSLSEQSSNVINQPKPSAEALIEAYGNVQAVMEAVLDESEEAGTQSILLLSD